jgi:hypothetical protein
MHVYLFERADIVDSKTSIEAPLSADGPLACGA